MSSKSGFALEDLLAITGWLVLIIGVLGGFSVWSNLFRSNHSYIIILLSVNNVHVL